MSKDNKNPSIVNRRAWHDYAIEETYVAGLVLVGTEVKSIRSGQVNFQDSFCRVDNGEVWLHNMYIAPYEFANRMAPDPRRPRKLLMRKDEIEKLRAKAEQKGLTVVPLKIFFLRGFAKMEIGVGKGKKMYDKRESIAERDIERDRRREESERG